METEDVTSNFNTSGKMIGTLNIVFALIGFFLFGWEGALGILLLGLLYGYATFFSIIPIIGVPIQYLVMTFAIKPFVFNLTPIQHGGLTLTMYWYALGMGILIQFIGFVFISNR